MKIKKFRMISIVIVFAFLLPMLLPGVEAFDLDPGGGSGGKKYAVVVGISDYQYMGSGGDLNYADDDAAKWDSFLRSKGYIVHWLGGRNDQRRDGIATEREIKNRIRFFASMADSGDTFVLVLSGHGGKLGSTYYCTYEFLISGKFWEGEIAAEMDNFAYGVNRFLFMDYCYAGGVGDNLMSFSDSVHIYCTTTCTANGLGYESSYYQNGYWTQFFLDNYLEHNPSWTMEYTFDEASDDYPYSGDDAPQEFDGSSSFNFVL